MEQMRNNKQVEGKVTNEIEQERINKKENENALDYFWFRDLEMFSENFVS